jgi:hypothetical protein
LIKSRGREFIFQKVREKIIKFHKKEKPLLAAGAFLFLHTSEIKKKAALLKSAGPGLLLCSFPYIPAVALLVSATSWLLDTCGSL